MKTRYSIAAGIAIIVAALSCTKLNEVPVIEDNGSGLSFILNCPSTKVSVAADGSTGWEAGDVIAVSDGTTVENVTLAASDINGTTATIKTTTLSASATGYYAVYPASAMNGSVSSGNITVKYSGTQTNAANKIAVATCAAGECVLPFKNVGCLLSFTTTFPCDEVEFVGAGGEDVGFSSYTVNPATGVEVSSGSPVTSVALSFEAGKTNYIALPGNGTSLSSGFKINLKKSGLVCATLEYGQSISLTRNKIYRMGDITGRLVRDYYNMYKAGMDITIGTKTYNYASKNKEPRLLKAYEMANTNPLIVSEAGNGILFLDYDPSDGKADAITATASLSYPSVVIIGRYSNHQPTVNMTFGYINANFVAKNVNFTGTSAVYLFSNENCTSSGEGVFEDCSFSCPSTFFRDGKATVDFKSLHFENCIFKYGTTTAANVLYTHANMTSASSYKTGTDVAIEKIYVNNCVFWAPSYSQNYLIRTRYGSKTSSSLDLTFTNNTVCNIAFSCTASGTRGQFELETAKSVTIKNNVWCSEIATVANTLILFMGSSSGLLSTSTINHNYCFSKEATGAKAWGAYTVAYTNLVNSNGANNTFLKLSAGDASPLASEDTVNGYFPQSAAAKTYGAGATYNTKKWRDWE